MTTKRKKKNATDDDAKMFACIGCGVHTGKEGEYYLIREPVWLAANPKRDGMMCIGCVEEHIGRKLEHSDFTFCPLNLRACFTGSERLKDRIGASTMLMFGLGDFDLRTIAVGIIEAEMAREKKINVALKRVRAQNKSRTISGAH
jgi:hypothetical protein